MSLHERLKGGLFLSSMMGHTDGSFCAERGEGCAVVQIGAYLAEPPAYGRAGYFLPPNREDCIRFFEREVSTIKRKLGIAVCVNLATPRLEWGLEAAECFKEAGGDILELNVHGGYRPYLERGLLRAMVLPENRRNLFLWLSEFSRLDIPIIVKFRLGVIDDYTPILDYISELEVFGVHFNIRDEARKRPDFEFVRSFKSRYDLFLLVSGYVRSAEDARRLFDLGADMVGIAEPVLKEPNYIKRLYESLSGEAAPHNHG